MSDDGSAPGAGRKTPTPQTSLRRRAPTITIDTSAVSSSEEPGALPMQPISNRRQATQQPSQDSASTEVGSDPTPLPADSQSPSRSQFDRDGELRAQRSFDSRDSNRPTSPHNISSPTSKWSSQPQNFLSVPSVRSRGNSVDSDDSSGHSPASYSGETYIPSAAPSQAGDEPHRAVTRQSSDGLLSDEDALKPDPGTEEDFEVQNNPFAYSPGQLGKLLNPKSLSAFHALGGLVALEKGLRTDRHAGLSIDETTLEGDVTFKEALAASGMHHEDGEGHPPMGRRLTDPSWKPSNDSFADRKRVFKDNRLPEKKPKSIWELAWLAYNDKVLILLTFAAVVSLALGIYQSIADKGGVEWVEGVAIVVAILIVVVVGALNDWQKERQFVKLNRKKEDRTVKVIRSGKSREISVWDILVGDILHLEPGDLIPVDGIFIQGHNIKCDESSATGESDILKKTPADEAFRVIESHEPLRKIDPFILSGGKVNEGVGTFLVTATGVNSQYGKTMMSLREDPQTTPLQGKLNVLAEYIAKLGLAAGLFLFTVTFIQFLTRLNRYPTGQDKGQAFLQVFIVAVTVIVVAVPEGLPLAVTLALAFATTRMTKDNNLVRILRACETMGNATTICSDKTGTLTQNKMAVVAGTLGTTLKFGDKQDVQADAAQGIHDITMSEAMQSLGPEVKGLLKDSIVLNSTAFEGDIDGKAGFIGSKTETAMLEFARNYLGMDSVAEERDSANIVQFVPFDSGRKCMAAVVKLASGKFRMYVKGASEIMLAACSNVLRDAREDVSSRPLLDDSKESINDMITDYATRSLRTIGVVYREFESWPPRNAKSADDPSDAIFEKVFKDMTFLGVVGIQDPLRDGVAAAVKKCQHAGVFVRMVTGDNLITAKAIATECGIFTAGGIVMEGPQFRKLSRREMNNIIPKLQVLARSSPEDKRTLVKRLRDLGETVAVTGDGTNDAPALKTADVGFSMGIAGTEVAKEASAIILMDDNFASIVKAMMWGRAVNDAVKKFLQFQITVNITAVLLTFISAVASPNQQSVLTAVQLLWVNLIMDTLAALALATDPPPESILDRPPQPKSDPLITINMWKMITGQSIYQLVVTLILNFAGPTIFKNPDTTPGGEMQTLVFNTFVWMQIFNQYNSRRLDNRFNVFEGIFRNRLFMGIQLIIVGGQVLIVFVGGAAFSVTRQNGAEWGTAIVLGLLCMPWAIVLRCINDEWIRKFIPQWLVDRRNRRKQPELNIEGQEIPSYLWNPAIEDIRNELTFLKRVRGGRLNALKYKFTHPSEFLPRSRSPSRSRTPASIPQTPTGDNNNNNEVGKFNEGQGASPAPPTPDSSRRSMRRRGRSRSNSAFGPAAAMAGIVAGSIAGWSPIEKRDGEESFASRVIPLESRAAIENNPGIELHPDTKPDDPVIVDTENLNAAPSQIRETRPEGATSAQYSQKDSEPPPSKAKEEEDMHDEKEIEAGGAEDAKPSAT